MNVSILVPFRSDGGERERIWTWARERWLRTMPDCELVVCDDGGEEGEPFNEGRAWNECARQASGDVFVLAESEVVNESAVLLNAIDSIELRGGWRIAETYFQLTREATAQVLGANPGLRFGYPIPVFTVKRTFYRESMSSNIVVPREAFELVGGYDERYDGWGWIDKSFAAALDTLYRPHERFLGANYHLDHARSTTVDCNPELTHRYIEARGDAKAMQEILIERVPA